MQISPARKNWTENNQLGRSKMFLRSRQVGILVIPAILLCKHYSLCKAEDKLPPNIAIIGAGIGGSSATHFSRQLFGPGANIHVFEAEHRLGGRLDTVQIDGKWYESGGSVIHPTNKHMDMFVKELGLNKLKSSEPNSLLGIYNGSDFVFMGSRWKVLNYLDLFWRYGFDLVTVDGFVNKMLKNFANIYTLQEKRQAFQTVPQMLHAMGGEELYGYTQENLRQALEKLGIQARLIDELVTAVMRINYGQDVTLNAFAGAVSLAGGQGGLWSVEGGNKKVCEGLLTLSRAQVHTKTTIKEILKLTRQGDSKPKYHLKGEGDIPSQAYDVVIVAAPLEVKAYYLECKGCENWPKQDSLGTFWQTVATFVKGEVNMSHFHFTRPEQIPEAITTMENPDIFFNSVGYQEPVTDRKKKDPSQSIATRKVFSRSELNPSQMNELFSSRNETKVVPWLAYPRYTPPERFLPFVLDKGVFYVNAIEYAASAMEMSALAGNNAALLSYHYYTGAAADLQPSVTVATGKKTQDEL